jgi:GntR family transcriptional regulator
MAGRTEDRITGGPRPKHQQLRELLIGMVVPGHAIPSERELMRIYGVSRATVRKAIDGLVADGLLSRTHGLGTFAVRPRLETRLHLASFSQDMRRRGLQPSTRLISVTLALPPAEVTGWLGLEPDQKAWRIVRVRLADNTPIAHEDGWYPAHLLPELDRQDLAGGSLYEILGASFGLWVEHAEQTLWGESADAGMAAALAAPLATPLLVFRRRSSAAGGQRIEHVVSRYRGDRYQVQMELSRDDESSATKSPGSERVVTSSDAATPR